MLFFPKAFRLSAALLAIAFVGAIAFFATGVASAAALGGAASSVGVFAALATLLMVRGWQTHLGAEGLSTLVSVLALATGAGLLWRFSAAFRGMSDHGQRLRRVAPSSTLVEPRETVGLPAHIERQVLLDELRRHFFALQSAWDAGARDAMSRLTTPDMLDELCAASSACDAQEQMTEFLSLDAKLLLFEQQGPAQVVCVEYSGMVREAPARSAAPFREVWMLTRSAETASEWRLARHQGLL